MRFFGRDKEIAEKKEEVVETPKKEIKKAIPKKIDVNPRDLQNKEGPSGKVINERMSKIEALLEEQKKLDKEHQRRKETKKRKGPHLIFKPFIALRNAINSLIRGIIHGFLSIVAAIVMIPLHLGHLISRGIGSFLQGVYNRAGSISPFGWKRKINQLVIYSGVNKTQEEITGITIVNGAALGIFMFVVSHMMMEWDLISAILLGLSSFVIVWIIAYSIINLMADKRTDEVEEALPDVLQIVSANISAGMTPYNALWVAARKEFGALAEEIKIAQKETLGGKAFTDSLTEMSLRVRSNTLQRTIRLIIQGMKAGGELPHILQGIGTDIRQMKLLQKEMAASTMSYILFILFGMIIGAPLLFSVSINFVDIMNKFQPDTLETDTSSGGSAMAGMQGFDMMSMGSSSCPKDFDGDGIPDKEEKDLYGLNPSNSSDSGSINPKTGNTYLKDYQKIAEPTPSSCVNAAYLINFALLALLSVAFFGALLIGQIRSGKQSAGVKLIPLLIPITLGMFLLMNTGMAMFFGAMFGG